VSGPQALLVDYGGVLTSPLPQAMASWCAVDGIDVEDFRAVMAGWLGADAAAAAVANPVHALERGELAVPHFEEQLAERLAARTGRRIEPAGLVRRMFAGFRREPTMVDVVRRVRSGGFQTALLSNSWGLDYDRAEWDQLFDAVVISGEVGMRKPDADIYLHTADRLGLPPQRCVFVDDIGINVKGAVAVGMVGVKFDSAEQTVADLEAIFGLALR
jgi:epoxide hydrolase-like predicted phosphatase